MKIPSETLQIIDKEIVNQYMIIPYEKHGNICRCFGVSRNEYSSVTSMLAAIHRLTFEVDIISEDEFNKIYLSNFRTSVSVKVDRPDFLNNLIAEAYQSYCSDIHFECYESRYRIRFRTDGKLLEKYTLEKQHYISLINQIKIMASLDIAEKRLPQDGRIFYNRESIKFDVRVSVMPSVYGEKVVMRLLTRHPELLILDNLGMDSRQLSDYKSAIAKPHGMLLISGPTGSGKSTTLYATLSLLNDVQSNIMTIEDPVEYTLDGVNQVQVKEDIGLDFSTALRTFLRQDPDVIMVGEIRDQETARIAVRSSMTGHLVLSTIHTNSALGCISRLEEMGISPYLQSETINLYVAQRLVRLLCPECKKKYEFRPGLELYAKVGCSNCFYTGYKGRHAIYEVIPMTEKLAEAIRYGRNVHEIITRSGSRSLSDSAKELLIGGYTSLEEVLSMVNIDQI